MKGYAMQASQKPRVGKTWQPDAAHACVPLPAADDACFTPSSPTLAHHHASAQVARASAREIRNALSFVVVSDLAEGVLQNEQIRTEKWF